ncbi:sugar-transfer associated ATP-grasp domain-containing protein [uncultured Eubacterium sp.]|mgnify:CR=1 FL=1|uniref:sugar-transfer associated ATP-grasp domain-containing protein n=1 Tax=uncultured Eubacterium sp. TaxID=165185 RepID=UPI00258D038E|nr:sugar-transfer associated ATP-grasp domain-containing protein [uncultured Eubacterium sp.]
MNKSFIKNCKFIAYIYVWKELKQWKKGKRNSDIEKAIDLYVDETKKQDSRFMSRIIKDMLFLKYSKNFTHFNEYFMFDFEKKNKKQRADYVETTEYKSYFEPLKERIGTNILKDKYLAYKKLSEYYNRDCICVNSFEDYTCFFKFVCKHKEFLLKAEEGSLGAGIVKFNINNIDNKTAFFNVIQKAPCVLEELIVQSDEMSKFNPSSVNTVRFVMFTNADGVVSDIYAMLRTGIGDTIVDNASMGGIACAVDTETGKVISNGYTKLGEAFIEHPISHVKYYGYQIPKWQELKHICYKASKQIPEYKYIGWDMALTEHGWIVVEANSCPSINTIQMCLGHGLRDVLEQTVYKLL